MTPLEVARTRLYLATFVRDRIFRSAPLSGPQTAVCRELEALATTCRCSLAEPVDGCHRFQASLRRMAEIVDRRYSKEPGNLGRDARTLGDPVSEASYEAVLHELFRSEVNWGRIVSMFVFLGEMSFWASQRVCEERPSVTLSYIEWTVAFVQSRLWTWIRENGGWDGLTHFESHIHHWNPTLVEALSSAAIVTAGTAACVYLLWRALARR